jgi:hypothetical protein
MSAHDSAAPDYVFADDPGAYRAGAEALRQQRAVAELTVSVLIAAVGGPFVQRRPTAAECRTDALDFYADKRRELGAAFVRSRMVVGRLAQLGLTVEQVEAWAALQDAPP